MAQFSTRLRPALAAYLLSFILSPVTAPALAQVQPRPAAPVLTPEERAAKVAERNRLWKEAGEQRSAGKFGDAIKRLEQDLAVQREIFGPRTIGEAQALEQIALNERDLQDWPSARRAAAKALAIRENVHGKDDWHTIDARLLAADIDRWERLTADQRQQLAEADRLIADAARSAGQGKYREALGPAQRALALRRQILGENHQSTADAWHRLGQLYNDLRDANNAKEANLGAMEIRRQVLGESHPDYATSMHNLASVYVGIGEYERAETLYKQSLEIRQKTLGASHSVCASSLNNLASLYDNMGEYARAEPLYKQALEVVKKSLGEMHPHYAASLNNLAWLYLTMGEYARAEPLYKQAMEIQKKSLGETHPDYAISLNNLALLYGIIGDYARAEPLFKQATEIRKKSLGEEHPYYARSLHNLASLYMQMGDYARAEPLYKQAAEIYKKSLGEAHPSYAVSLNNLALLYGNTGDYARAESLYKQSLNIRQRSLGEAHPDYALSLNNLALLELDLGRAADAEKHLLQAVRIDRKSIDLTAAVQSEQQQLAMTGELRFYLDNYLSGALAAGIEPTEIYAEVAAWKGSVSAQQQLLRARERASTTDPNSELARFFAQLNAESRRLATLSRLIPKPGEEAGLQKKLDELSESVNSLQQQLARLDPDFHRAWADRKISPDELRQNLPAGTALVDLLEYDHYLPPAEKGKQAKWQRRVIAFVMRRDQPIACVQLGPSKPIGRLVEAWRSGFGSLFTSDGKRPGAELRRLVWLPLDKHLAGAETVLISPDGAVARLAWGALPGEKPATFLIEERAIAVAPIPQQLPELLAASSRPAEASLLTVGDVDFGAEPGATAAGQSRAAMMRDGRVIWQPLPGTKVEVDQVQLAFGRCFAAGRRKVLDKGAATEAELRRMAERHRWLHLATHGFFSPPPAPASKLDALQVGAERNRGGVHPGLLSGIVLAGANLPVETDRDDGILTALEVSGLNLQHVDLAVLSACETGLGQSSGGEGVLGLQRAFQVAGARTVVSGLWKVPDRATQMLMVRFYENLWQRKMPKLAALREAQRWMLRTVPHDPKLLAEATRGLDIVAVPASSEGEALSPYYWAAFVLSGDWR